MTILFWPKEVVPNYHFMVFDPSMTLINELERTELIQCKSSPIFSWGDLRNIKLLHQILNQFRSFSIKTQNKVTLLYHFSSLNLYNCGNTSILSIFNGMCILFCRSLQWHYLWLWWSCLSCQQPISFFMWVLSWPNEFCTFHLLAFASFLAIASPNYKVSIF